MPSQMEQRKVARGAVDRAGSVGDDGGVETSLLIQELQGCVLQKLSQLALTSVGEELFCLIFVILGEGNLIH